MGCNSKRTDVYTLQTHWCSPTGYNVTEDLRQQKQGGEIIAAAFSDRFAVLLTAAMTTPFIHRGKGVWRMNTSYLIEQHFQDKIKDA